MKKQVLITGVNGGIGKSLAEAFHAADYEVVGVDIHATSQLPLYVGTYYTVDLFKYVMLEDYRMEIHTMWNALKNVHVLINNAAVQRLGHVDGLDLKDWQETMAVNLTAPMLLSQFFLPTLSTTKGSIINIGSIHQTLTKPSFVAYATSKSALIGLTKALALDIGSKVRVNAISPAAIETDMLKAGFNNDESAIAALRKIHPTGDIGQGKDVARAALFLANPENTFLNGCNLTLDGGISSVLHDL